MADLHQTITDAILAQLAAGPGPWTCPWHRTHGGLPANALTRQPYHGINILSLWCAEQARGFVQSRWATYRQWSQLGAQVRRGEKGTCVIFYKDLPAPDPGHPGSHDDDHPRFVARASYVFNAAQVDGAPELADNTPVPPTSIDPTPAFDRFVQNTGAMIQEGETACYQPALDLIDMPSRQRFVSAEGYTATLAHELIHWTGHLSRLDRQLTTRFGTRAYAAEELVAELGSAFVLASLDLAPTPHPNHAAYISHWLPLVRTDPRALLIAAAHAARAADHLTALQRHADVSISVSSNRDVVR